MLFNLARQAKIFVALEPTDMRRGFDGLSGTVQQTLEQDPLSGHLFLFRNRRRDRIKILFWDGDGYVLFYKRLARGTFEFPVSSDPESSVLEIRASELAMLLDGIELKGRKRRPRYERPHQAACSNRADRVA
jgi:transposase